MNAIPMTIDGAWVIESQIFKDERGSFSEWYKKTSLANHTEIDFEPVQANISVSSAGVIRGIHYSLAPRGQSKLITVMSGSILDVAVDLRIGSPTFGTYEPVILSAGDGKSILLGHDLAHGFQALEDNTIVSYLVSAEYDPVNEQGVTPLCTSLNIKWDEFLKPILSAKDAAAPNLIDRLENKSLRVF